MIKKVNIIGAGNVGSHLAKALVSKIVIVNVFSNNLKNAQSLVDVIGGKAVSDISKLDSNVDLNIISIKDDFIENVIKSLPINIPTVHTSGTKDIGLLSQFENYGSFYPLQTFSKGTVLDISKVPFLIEGNNKNFETVLIDFCALNLSKNIKIIDSESRANIHLAAVLTNNFSTQLLVEAESILKKSNIDLSILQPLLEETIRKAFLNTPKNAITGPAKREDLKVLEKQYNAIEKTKLKSIYKLMSELIMGKSLNF